MSYIYIGQYYDKTGRPLESPYKKVGKSIDVPRRENSLNNTRGPIGYIMVAMWKVGDDYTKIEQALHAILDDVRVDGEWFTDEDDTLVNRIAGFMEKLGYQNIPIVAQDEEEQQELERIRNRAPVNIDWLGLHVGDTIAFRRDPTITATIHTANKIQFRDEITSLSRAAKELLGRVASGPVWWMFAGETLSDRRLRMERDGTYGPQSSPKREVISENGVFRIERDLPRPE